MITKYIAEYFGAYLGVNLIDPPHQVTVAFTHRRDQPERGWGYAIPVWVVRTSDLIVISSSQAHTESVTVIADELRARLPTSQPMSAIVPIHC
jgi:hypothetical protein